MNARSSPSMFSFDSARSSGLDGFFAGAANSPAEDDADDSDASAFGK